MQRLAAAAGRGLVYLSVIVALSWKGAAIPVPFLVTCLLAAAALLLSLTRFPQPRVVERLFFASLVLAAGLAAFAFAQSLWTPAWLPRNEAWTAVNDLLGFDRGAISVNPAMTREAILSLVMPFALFSASLVLFPGDTAALRLIKFLALVGLGFAAFGLVQVTFLPRSLLFFEKLHYTESLTSVMVNRNTAGTLLGTASLAMLCWFAAVWKSVENKATLATDRWDEPGVLPAFAQRKNKLAVIAAGFATILIALFLTKSRGAMLATVVAYLVVLPMLVGHLRNTERGERANRRREALWSTLAALAAIAAVVLSFGNLTGERLAEGVDSSRLCIYRASLRMFADHWLLGTGFGTFESAFPMYRTADCGLVRNYFVRAHNSFLEALAGFGILFVPALIFAYVRIAGLLRRGFETRRRFRFVPLCGLGALLIASVHSLVDFSLQIPGMAAYFAVFLGACASICLRRDDKRLDAS